MKPFRSETAYLVSACSFLVVFAYIRSSSSSMRISTLASSTE